MVAFRIIEIASSSSRDTGRGKGTEVPATSLGNILVFSCSFALKYRL